MLILATSLLESPGDWINNQIHRLLLVIDQTVYWFASQCYQLFIKLATARIFEDNFFANFAKRIYAIIGVFMLFYLAYALLTAIVDPDKLTKGDKGVGKIASNLIISLVIIGLLPSIFDYAYRLQNYILSSNLLGTLILGTDPIDVNDTDDNTDSLVSYGDALSFMVLNVFLNPENENVNAEGGYTWYGIKNAILDDGEWRHIQNMYVAVSTGVPENGKNYVVTYHLILSTIAGFILIYLMLSFVLDLGIRIVKFAFYQLIAPIPVIMRILPSKKSVFDKWLKQTLSVYFEIFIRVGIMYMAIYFINAIYESNTFSEFWEGGFQGKVALLIIVMGILAFARQVPKLISDTLGLDTGGLKLGIRDKLKAGGFFAAGSAVGAAVTSRFNPFAIARGWNKGWHDGNFRAIGEEAMLRQEVQKARSEGSTWLGRRNDDIRRYFGYDSSADEHERRIERNTPFMDGNHELTDDEVIQMKQEKAMAQRRNAEIDERVKEIKRGMERNEALNKYANSAMDNAKKAVNKSDATVTGTTSDFGYGSITGNLSTIRSFIRQIDHVDTEALKSRYTTNGVLDQTAYDEALKHAREEHATTMEKYQKEMEKMEKEFVKQQIDEVLHDPSHSDVETRNALDQLKAVDPSITITSGDAVKGIRDTSQNALNTDNINIQREEQSKFSNNETIARAERIESERKQRVEEQKNTREQQGRYASKNIKRGGGH